MKYFEDENIWFNEDDEITKLKREVEIKQREKINNYKKSIRLFNYFIKLSKEKEKEFFYNKDNIKTLNKMLNIFIENEEYEKCSIIKTWLEKINTNLKIFGI